MNIKCKVCGKDFDSLFIGDLCFSCYPRPVGTRVPPPLEAGTELRLVSEDRRATCPEHGEQAVVYTTKDTVEDLSHDTLVCGCTLERKPVHQITEGDAVLLDGVLFSVWSADAQTLYLENRNGTKNVPRERCTFVAVDTLSEVDDVKAPKKKKGSKKLILAGDYVRHKSTSLVGRVEASDVADGLLRCYVNTSETAYRTYLWEPQNVERMTESDKASACTCPTNHRNSYDHNGRCPLYYYSPGKQVQPLNFNDNRGWDWRGSGHYSAHAPSWRTDEGVKKPKDSISTADLLRSEVKKLEREQDDPATDAPAKKRDKPDPPPDAPIVTKRRGTW